MDPIMMSAFADEFQKIALSVQGAKVLEGLKPLVSKAKPPPMPLGKGTEVLTSAGSLRSAAQGTIRPKVAAAPLLLAGMKGPNPMVRAALGATKAVPKPALPSKLPGAEIGGKSLAVDLPPLKGPQFKMKSAL